MATSTLAADSNNDLYLVDGRNLGILNGSDACSQNILDATQMRLAEDQYNVNTGVDYMGTVFVQQHQDYTAFRASLTQEILSSPDVLSIESLEIGPAVQDPNTLLYLVQVQTIYGLQAVSGQATA